jgi:hypothetical protein
MYGQALGWMEWKVWIPSLFSASVPRSLCGFVPSFLTNLKISSPFFLDLTCAIIQRCLFSGRGERADFCDSSSSYYLLLLLLFLIFNIIFFFLLLFFLGCRLFACHDYYSYLLHPAERRGRGNGVSRLIQYCGHGTRMESGGVVHLRVLV